MDFDKLYNKTLHFLSFRPRSEKEVRDYLLKHKAGLETTEKIINKLKEYKFIDDEEFTRWWIEQRTILKPKASRIIKFELKQKGIDRQLIDSFFEDNKDSTADFTKALKLAERKMSRYAKIEDKRKVYEKMGRFLASKGFNWDTIKAVIDQILGK